jgi:hypothetical protein
MAVVAVAALGAACASSTAPAASLNDAGCRSGPPEAGVYQPDRLHVLNPCQHAEGVVVDVAHEDDGDYHVWFSPAPGYEHLLNAEDHFQGRPAMLGEITPDCTATPVDGSAAARCPKSGLQIPALGDHIAIDGPWVLDMNHGWLEIHPVDSIKVSAHA